MSRGCCILRRNSALIKYRIEMKVVMKTEEDGNQLKISLFSFGFKHGMPAEVNLVWDVRFLPNPYWEEPLRHLTGMDGRISSYVLESEAGREFINLLVPLLRFLIAENREAGKTEMRIGIGCTGGRHRSVAVVERLSSILHKENIRIETAHRDIEKE